MSSVDKGVQSLARISLSPGGRDFLSSLDRGEAGICLELLDRVRPYFMPSSVVISLNDATGTD